MPLILLLLFVFAIDLYAYQAVQLAISDFSPSLITILTIAYWMIPVAAILILGVFQSYLCKDGNQCNFLIARSVFFLIYLSKFTFVLFLLVGDLGQLVVAMIAYFSPGFSFDCHRSMLFTQMSMLVAGTPLMIMLYGIVRNRHRYKIFKENVTIPNLPKNLEGLKIVQISDIHSGSFSDAEPIKKGIDLINEQNPDLVFFTGDLVNSTATEIEPYTTVFDKIKSKYGVFSIFGNHDYGDYAQWPSAEAKENNLNQLKSAQKQMGWQLLLNENRLLNINGEKIAIIGVENYSANARFSKYGDLAKAYEGSQAASLKLLLSHDPSHWDHQVINNFKDIALTFSGHTHGAQFGIEIPGFFKWSPIKYMYKQWAGLYKKGTQYLYVNRGFGYLGYPGRIGILPEITVINLRTKS